MSDIELASKECPGCGRTTLRGDRYTVSSQLLKRVDDEIWHRECLRMGSMKTYEYKTASHRLGKLPDGSFAPPFVDWLNKQGAQGWHLSTMVVVPPQIMLPVEHFCVFARFIDASGER